MVALALLLATRAAGAEVELGTTWLNLGVPDVHVVNGATFAINEWRGPIEERFPSTRPQFAHVDDYRQKAVRGFWIGAAGMIASLYFAHDHVPRTAGNAL